MAKETAKIIIEGKEYEVSADEPFTVVLKLAKENGLRKIIILCDGKELPESADPDTVGSKTYEVVRDDSAGR